MTNLKDLLNIPYIDESFFTNVLEKNIVRDLAFHGQRNIDKTIIKYQLQKYNNTKVSATDFLPGVREYKGSWIYSYFIEKKKGYVFSQDHLLISDKKVEIIRPDNFLEIFNLDPNLMKEVLFNGFMGDMQKLVSDDKTLIPHSSITIEMLIEQNGLKSEPIMDLINQAKSSFEPNMSKYRDDLFNIKTKAKKYLKKVRSE